MDLLIAPNTVPQGQADAAPITGTPAWATSGNPATNTPATIFPAYAFNALQAELTAAIQAAGITLDRTKLNQLAAAIQVMTQGGLGTHATDTGSANAYAITLTPAPAAISPGMIVGVSAIIAANTGAATLNTNGLGALPIHGPGGAALQGGEFVGAGNAILRANATATAWDLVWTTGAQPTASATASNQAINLGQLFIGNRKAVFTGNGAWAVPAGVTQIWVSGCGGGGGGGGGNSIGPTTQGAGGGGGFCGTQAIKTAVAVTPGHSLAIVIGGGGAGGAGTTALANAGNGVVGGNTVLTDTTSATTLVTLLGGNAGSGAVAYSSSAVYGGNGFQAGMCLQAQSSTGPQSGSFISYGGCGQGGSFGNGGGAGFNGNVPTNAGYGGGGGGGG
ncbi:MAG: hypothetical protein HKL99_05455, partial [Burkholderiales bacterium]|nr:hypothetical protein [Burkholderiales bacterium]